MKNTIQSVTIFDCCVILYNQLKLTIMKNYLLYSLLFLVFISCQNIEEQTTTNEQVVSIIDSVIKPPIGDVSVPVINFSINVEKGGEFALSNGSKIVIPKNAFVSLDGNLLSGLVNLTFQEFHSLSDVLLSGIPMKYDSAGVEYDFTSAGMFTVTGEQNNNKIKIAPSKSIQIAIASNVEDTPCYNFYKLDDKTGKWNYKATKKATENPGYVGNIIPEKPKEVSEGATIIDLNINNKKIPELAIYESLLWEYDGEENPESLNIEQNWGKVTLEKREGGMLCYNLVLKSLNEEKTIPVKPAFSGENLKKAQDWYTEKLAEAKEKVEKIEDLEKKRLIRSIHIDQFGTHNWDYFAKRQFGKTILANFNLGEEIDPSLVTVFIICPGENLLTRHKMEPDIKINYSTKLKNKMIATLPDGKVAIFKPNDFKKLASIPDYGKYTFNMKILDQTIESPEDLEAVIESM